jgi:hypothetical protein
MTTQILGADGTSIVAVDPLTGAMRVSQRPRANLGWFSIASVTGAIAAPAANLNFYMIRPTTTRALRIKSLKLSASNSGTTTAAGVFDVQTVIQRGVTASSGGASPSFTDGSGKFISTQSVPDAEIRVSTTAAITVTGGVVDTSALFTDRAFFALGAPAVGRVLNTEILSLEDDASAFILFPGEALVLRTATATPAVSSMVYNINAVFAMLEVADV